ncbi:hypothetical protein, partial [Phenylobacterium sp.]|uniref:hypothetical protein n=1 Tax=Phenylobacterium sp. TaxID=1871053 RepID=UPI0027346C57
AIARKVAPRGCFFTFFHPMKVGEGYRQPPYADFDVFSLNSSIKKYPFFAPKTPPYATRESQKNLKEIKILMRHP